MLPVRFIKLLIPPLKTISNIDVVGNPVEIELESIDLKKSPIFPYQNPVSIGSEPEKFIINTALYGSKSVHPSVIYENNLIGYSRGYAILDLAMIPIQYIPGEGRLFYYPEMTVTIHLEETEDMNQFYRNNPEDETWVKNIVWNPEIAERYKTEVPTFSYPGGLCDPSDDYDYVIITTTYNDLDYWETSEETPYNWESLMDKHKEDDDLRCTLVTIQDIDDCEDYYNDTPLFDDIQAHIREFCKDAYQDWGTNYVFIGGDAEYIPARLMTSEVEMGVDADIYWNHLDGTFNDDHDVFWGEKGDTGFDLYGELFIGRITCDEPQDVSNWMTKSFYYADNSNISYLENAAFYGGNSGWPCEGDDFIDFSAIKGTEDWLGPDPQQDGPWPTWLGFLFGFETWNAENPTIPFNLSIMWTAEPPNPGWQGGSTAKAIAGFRDAINNDLVTIISGIAHATETMSLDVQASSWESQYTNTKPFFIHDQGCHCGDMNAAEDGVLHSMLFHSDTKLAFGCVYNTGFGWGNLYTTNSSSSLQAKLFWDYFLDVENNSGGPVNWELGKAHAWSKDVLAPTINWGGSWRETIQCCLLFGDPAQRLKPPNTLNTPPERPERPDGPIEGKVGIEYTYSSNSIDPDGDKIYYMFDWGDGTDSDWLGPCVSGDIVEASHIWTDPGEFEIRVKARDVNGGLSDWSDSFAVTMPRDKAITYSLFLRFFECFPLLEGLFKFFEGG
jgi:hypothetical protein